MHEYIGGGGGGVLIHKQDTHIGCEVWIVDFWLLTGLQLGLKAGVVCISHQHLPEVKHRVKIKKSPSKRNPHIFFTIKKIYHHIISSPLRPSQASYMTISSIYFCQNILGWKFENHRIIMLAISDSEIPKIVRRLDIL